METNKHKAVDPYKGPKHLEPPREKKENMAPQPDPDVENYAEVGDNVQKSMDQALEFQNQPTGEAPRSIKKNQEPPLLLPHHH